MAGSALAGCHALHGGVSESGGCERASCCMTGVARETGRNVITRLAVRLRAVVAGGAGAWFGVHVSEARAHPRGGAMAGIARLVGDRVIRRFARDDVVVMALLALMGDYADVGEPRHLPRGGRGMALVTRLICGYVIRGFDGGALNTTAPRVAGFAFFGRALEGALDMAGFAGNLHMCPGQRKSRFHVIETHIAFGVGRRRVAVRNGKQEQTQHGNDANPGQKSPEIMS